MGKGEKEPLDSRTLDQIHSVSFTKSTGLSLQLWPISLKDPLVFGCSKRFHLLPHGDMQTSKDLENRPDTGTGHASSKSTEIKRKAVRPSRGAYEFPGSCTIQLMHSDCY